MRDNKNYLSKNMFYNINVTILLQLCVKSRILQGNSLEVLVGTQAIALHEV